MKPKAKVCGTSEERCEEASYSTRWKISSTGAGTLMPYEQLSIPQHCAACMRQENDYEQEEVRPMPLRILDQLKISLWVWLTRMRWIWTESGSRDKAGLSWTGLQDTSGNHWKRIGYYVLSFWRGREWTLRRHGAVKGEKSWSAILGSQPRQVTSEGDARQSGWKQFPTVMVGSARNGTDTISPCPKRRAAWHANLKLSCLTCKR